MAGVNGFQCGSRSSGSGMVGCAECAQVKIVNEQLRARVAAEPTCGAVTAFDRRFVAIYGSANCTPNQHAIIHLADCIRTLVRSMLTGPSLGNE